VLTQPEAEGGGLLRPRAGAPGVARLDDRERAPHVAPAERVREIPGLRFRERRRQALHLLDADRLARGPRRELVYLACEHELVVADDVEERLARVAPGLDVPSAKALGDPCDGLLLADLPGEDGAELRHGLRERRILLHLFRDEAENRTRGRVAQVRDDRLDIVRLPSTREAVELAPLAVDVRHQDEPFAPEQRARVACRDDV